MALYVGSSEPLKLNLNNQTYELNSYPVLPSPEKIKFLVSEIKDTVTKAQKEQDEPTFSFILFADVHNIRETSSWQNWDDTVLSIKNVNALYPVDAIYSLGDNIEGDTDADFGTKRLEKMREDLYAINPNSFMLTGNHDTNDYERNADGSFTHNYIFSKEYLYEIISKYSASKLVTDNSKNNYGYYDIEPLGIRVVMLDCIIGGEGKYGSSSATWGYDEVQVEWVRNVALNTSNQVIFLSHMGVTKEFNYGLASIVNGATLRDDIIKQFIANGGTVVGMFHGHTHWDYINKYSEINGFYEISTASANDNKTSSSTKRPENVVIPSRKTDTVTQELWELVIVKPLSRTVKMIRFGAGEDREFTY